MSELKRTQLYDVHVQAGATMVDFGGWEMPIQYPSGIVSEHLYTRHACSLFDVSHMGRLLVEGPDRLAFLQHVLTSNVAGLDLNMAQYCIIPAPNGSAVDDAYLYRFEEERYLLVVNAANTDKDLAHLEAARQKFDCTLTNQICCHCRPGPQEQRAASDSLRRRGNYGAHEKRFEHPDL